MRVKEGDLLVAIHGLYLPTECNASQIESLSLLHQIKSNRYQIDSFLLPYYHTKKKKKHTHIIIIHSTVSVWDVCSFLPMYWRKSAVSLSHLSTFSLFFPYSDLFLKIFLLYFYLTLTYSLVYLYRHRNKKISQRRWRQKKARKGRDHDRTGPLGNPLLVIVLITISLIIYFFLLR